MLGNSWRIAATVVALLTLPVPARAASAGTPETPEPVAAVRVQEAWYHLILDLVRHTPTYSPPVAARAFAYLGVTGYEAVAGGTAGLTSLSGQLKGMPAMPARDPAGGYSDAVVLTAAMADATHHYFGNTGPSGQRAAQALESRLRASAAEGLAPDVVSRSETYGRAVADAVWRWSLDDGGADIQNMGFPDSYTLKPGPGHWVPTSAIRQQQVPLLPDWGQVRSFAMPDGAACPLPPPPEYSEDPASEFYRQAREVRDTVRDLTGEQEAIARFWSDDPMLSPTPPGHWISIALAVLADEQADLVRRVDVLARLGVASADAFIGCWHTKFEYDLVRPVTYIRRLIDARWEPLLITPPFPEYPSGHSTLSGAAAEVLSNRLGDHRAFVDATHEPDHLAPRSFPDFRAAAREAAVSRRYGGIHFQAAIDAGLEQGRCVAAYAIALKTGK